MFYMPILLPTAFIISVPLLIVGAIALISGGAFIGSQIDDKIEQTMNPLPKAISNIPYWITIPAMIAISVFGITIAKKWSKKL